MRILEKSTIQELPLTWINLEYYPDSKAERCEIYLDDKSNLQDGLMLMFYTLFRDYRTDTYIYNASWWDFCLETWDAGKNEYNYNVEGKSPEVIDYLKMLNDSNIKTEFSGICKCLDWDTFLLIVLKCILSHKAPYSPVFYNEKKEFFFYFHHTGSIGFYYKKYTESIRSILNIAEEDYRVESL